jgi:hypothetical protein
MEVLILIATDKYNQIVRLFDVSLFMVDHRFWRNKIEATTFNYRINQFCADSNKRTGTG